MTHESPSPLVFRYLATGTPSTDTYFARGPRGTRAWFDGFRDGEFLFAVPHIGLVDLDEAAYADAVRDHLTIALNQVWAGSGSRVAWLFQTASEADALRDRITSLVTSQREAFPDAQIDVRVADVSGLIAKTHPVTGRATISADELLAHLQESTQG